MDVAEDGDFDIDIRVASASDGGAFRLLWDDQSLHTGDIDVGNTGGWQSWQTRTVSNVALTSGRHILKVLITQNDVNLNTLHFRKTGPTNVEGGNEVPIAPELQSVYPNPFSGVVNIDFVSTGQAQVTAALYDVLGRRVFVGLPEVVSVGANTLKIQPNVVPGVYMLRLTVDGRGESTHQFTRSVVVMR